MAKFLRQFVFLMWQYHTPRFHLVKSVQSTLIVSRLPAFSWSVDYLNTTYIEQTDLGVGFHNLMNNLKLLTFRVKKFQLLLSMKSHLNVNS